LLCRTPELQPSKQGSDAIEAVVSKFVPLVKDITLAL
jgi:hypothetical protein